MRGVRPVRRFVGRISGRLTVASVAMVALAASCSSGPSQPAPKVEGLIGFDENAASVANFPVPKADAFFNCGSTTEGFGTELLHTSSPQLAHVRYEWGDIVPGKNMFEVGTAVGTVVGHGGDLPFTHPFGDDMTFNVQLDKPYAPLAQKVGPDPNDIPAGSVHTEIPEGLLPTGSDGQPQPDFIVKDGDRVAAYGPWILDCGHTDFHTEIHPTNFVAFGHADGDTTTAQAVYNPYVVTQLFSPDGTKVAAFGDTARFADALTQTFPKYLYQEILRLAGAGPGDICCQDQLEAHVLVDANRSPGSISWYVCAPPGGSGDLTYASKFTVRSGVSITASPDQDLGCVRMTATIGKGYTPMDPPRQECALSWDTLTEQASEAVGEELDVKAAIESLVPASLIPKVEKSPIIDCYQLPVAPPPGGDQGKAVFVSDAQPFPFYGSVQVSRKP